MGRTRAVPAFHNNWPRPSAPAPRRGPLHALACAAVLASAIVLTPPPAHAQILHHEYWVPNGTVDDVLVANGRVYLGGNFTRVGPATGAFIGVDATTGATLHPFPDVVGIVYAMTGDGAGGWYIGGLFTSVRGEPRLNLAHLDAAGNLTAWNPGASSTVTCMARDGATGIVYIGGNFLIADGQSRSGLAAIDAGGAATSWNPWVTGPSVNALALHGATLYVGGDFSTVSGQPRSRAAAFDLSTGALTSWSPSFDGAVFALATYEMLGFPPTVTVYAAGAFLSVSGHSRFRLAAVDGETAAVNPWNPGANGPVVSMAAAGGSHPLFDPVRLYVGGLFTLIGSSPRDRLAEIQANGATTAWNPGANGPVSVLALAGNLLYVGGEFTSIGGQTVRHLAAVDRASGLGTGWDAGLGRRVAAIGSTGSAVFVGGEFWTAGGVARNRLAALDLVTGQPAAWNPDANGAVRTLGHGDGVIYAGGDFTTVGGQSRARIAALDPTSGAPTGWNPGADQRVSVLTPAAGLVYAGGDFGTIGGATRSRAAALDATSGLATAWNPGANATVLAVTVDGPSVYLGGHFTTLAGTLRRGLGRVSAATGALDTWDPDLDPNPNYGLAWVERILIHGSHAWIGGIFGGAGGRQRTNLAVINTTSALANQLDPYVDDAVLGFAMAGSTLYVGGLFSSVAGLTRHGVAALDPVTGTIHSYALPPLSAAAKLAYHDGRLFVAGGFRSTHATFAVFSNPVLDASGLTAGSDARLEATPNPSRAEVLLRFSVPGQGPYAVTIHDLAGRSVRRLTHGAAAPGEQRVTWDGLDAHGRRVPAGVYFARVASGERSLTARVLRVE